VKLKLDSKHNVLYVKETHQEMMTSRNELQLVLGSPVLALFSSNDHPLSARAATQESRPNFDLLLH
jgi:hypothetical protein